MSKKDFAERIGMKPSQFSRILNGRQHITVETAEAIFRAFEARSDFGFEFQEDLVPAQSNRSLEIFLKYQKNLQVDPANNVKFVKEEIR